MAQHLQLSGRAVGETDRIDIEVEDAAGVEARGRNQGHQKTVKSEGGRVKRNVETYCCSLPLFMLPLHTSLFTLHSSRCSVAIPLSTTASERHRDLTLPRRDSAAPARDCPRWGCSPWVRCRPRGRAPRLEAEAKHVEGIAHQKHPVDAALVEPGATAVMEAIVFRPTACGHDRIVRVSPGRSGSAGPTSASLVVSPRPTPPVTTISGAYALAVETVRVVQPGPQHRRRPAVVLRRARAR